VHTCLRFNLKFLSERCAAEENKLSAVEFRDIRLRPKLAKVCSEERVVYCKVRGGDQSRYKEGSICCSCISKTLSCCSGNAHIWFLHLCCNFVSTCHACCSQLSQKVADKDDILQD
jgi:hypothetical protein